jgi:hypothetical protein
LKKIHIEKSDIGSEKIAELIRLPRGLEEVKFSIGGRWTDDGADGCEMVPGHIGRALLYHRHSLKTLDLDLDYLVHDSDYELEDELEDEQGLHRPVYDPHCDKQDKLDAKSSHPPRVDDSRPYGSSIGSLHDFLNLTHLSIGIKMLLGVSFPLSRGFLDVLPPFLESLTLRGYQKSEVPEYDEAVEELMANKVKFPKLKVILGLDETIPNSVGADNFEDILDRLRRERPDEDISFMTAPDWVEKNSRFWEPEEAEDGWEEV